jgi:hypothetical protein
MTNFLQEELSKEMQLTTQNLESKLIKAVKFDLENDEYNMDFLNEESPPKDLKEPSDRAANFQKLQKQVKEFKSEMFSTKD